MKEIKGKTVKWWVGIVLCITLFAGIITFASIKMSFVVHGVQIQATVDHAPNSSLATVKGAATNAVYLSLNGREIFIDKNGAFSETIALLPGLGIITLDAEDKFGNVAEKKIQIMYTENKQTVAFNNY